MSTRPPFRAIDPEGVTDGDYSVSVVGGVVAGLTAAAGGGGGSASLTQSYAGKNAIGASLETMATRRHYLKKITLTSPALISDVEAYLVGTSNVQAVSFGLWADASGEPGQMLSTAHYPLNQSLHIGGAGGWVGCAIGRWRPAGDYWIGCVFRYASGVAWSLAYDAAGTDRFATAGGDWMQYFAAGVTTAASKDYSIRACLIQ